MNSGGGGESGSNDPSGNHEEAPALENQPSTPSDPSGRNREAPVAGRESERNDDNNDDNEYQLPYMTYDPWDDSDRFDMYGWCESLGLKRDKMLKDRLDTRARRSFQTGNIRIDSGRESDANTQLPPKERFLANYGEEIWGTNLITRKEYLEEIDEERGFLYPRDHKRAGSIFNRRLDEYFAYVAGEVQKQRQRKQTKDAQKRSAQQAGLPSIQVGRRTRATVAAEQPTGSTANTATAGPSAGLPQRPRDGPAQKTKRRPQPKKSTATTTATGSGGQTVTQTAGGSLRPLTLRGPDPNRAYPGGDNGGGGGGRSSDGSSDVLMAGGIEPAPDREKTLDEVGRLLLISVSSTSRLDYPPVILNLKFYPARDWYSDLPRQLNEIQGRDVEMIGVEVASENMRIRNHPPVPEGGDPDDDAGSDKLGLTHHAWDIWHFEKAVLQSYGSLAATTRPAPIKVMLHVKGCSLKQRYFEYPAPVDKSYESS